MVEPMPMRLGDVASFRNGLNFTKDDRGAGCPYVGVPDFSAEGPLDYTRLAQINAEIASHEDYLRSGDIVLVRSNGNKELVGRSIYIPSDTPALFSGFCIRVRIDAERALPLFVYYFSKSSGFRKQLAGTGGSNINNLNQTVLGDVKLPKHSFTEQEKIATMLSALDAKIDLNNRINAELEALAKTIYDYWFVQFDFPDAKGHPYRASGGKMIWSEALKRKIPAEWEARPISTLVAKQKNGEWGAGEAGDGTDAAVVCIRGADINALNGSGELKAPTRYISSSRRDKFLAPNDLVIEISGGSPTQSTGRAALVGPDVIGRFDTPLVCSNFCKALTLKNPEQGRQFLHHWNSLYAAGIFFGWEGKTSGIKNLQFDSFVSSHNVPVPPEKLTRSFHDFSRSLEQRKQKGLRENQELTRLRDWLLPLLMNGQVRVA